jgi:hypothetical protein
MLPIPAGIFCGINYATFVTYLWYYLVEIRVLFSGQFEALVPI